MRSRSSLSILALAVGLGAAGPAAAHVSVAGPAVANTNQVLTFSVGHGCEGADTLRVRVDLPPEVTTLRGIASAYGELNIVTSTAGTPIAVEWSKPAVRMADDQYYQFQIRARMPDRPFTTLYFAATQVCRDAQGMETTVEWRALPGEMGEPAAALTLLPRRYPGWNKWTVPAEVDAAALFADAQIVWAGDSAYSSNPAISELIATEPGVTPLSMIPANAEVWVKY